MYRFSEECIHVKNKAQKAEFPIKTSIKKQAEVTSSIATRLQRNSLLSKRVLFASKHLLLLSIFALLPEVGRGEAWRSVLK